MNAKRNARLAVAACAFALFAFGVLIGYQAKKHKVRVATAAAERAAILDRPISEDLAEIRSLTIALEPRLKNEDDPLRIALLLRNLMHWRIPFVNGNQVRYEDYNFVDIVTTYKQSLLDPRYGHMCGGRVIEYLVALKAFGLTARKVGMYPDVTNVHGMVNSHASVEILIGEQWIALDPQFNVSIRDEHGNRIGWQEAFDLTHRGKPLITDSDGFGAHPQYSIERYVELTNLRFSDFLKFMNTSPYWDDQNDRIAEPTTMPATWDGVIRYAGGAEYPVRDIDSKSIYLLLAKHVDG